MFLLCYFLFLGKTYNNQKQKGFIIFQKKPLELSENFHRKTPVLESLFSKVAGLQVCSVNIIVFFDYC